MSAQPADTPRVKRLLLVAYHFGPGCATGGFRWNATAEYLCNAGWNIDVITLARPGLASGVKVDARGAGARDMATAASSGRIELFPVDLPHWPSALLAALIRSARWLRERLARDPKQCEERSEAVDPNDLHIWAPGYRRSLGEHVLHSLIYFAREAADFQWSLRALRHARKLARSRAYRAVLVCSPPQITQIVGEKLSRGLGIPYVADYRDPWILGLGELASYYIGPERVIGRHLEKRTLRAARVAIHNTERARAAVAREFALRAEHHAIPNGYDDADEAEKPDPACFRVVFTGHLHPFMDVRPVFEACAQLRNAHSLDAERLRIEFIGSAPDFEGVSLRALAGAYGLADVFAWRERVSQQEVRRFQHAAAVLVAFDSVYPVVVPSKFYEYARMKGTMLLIGNREGAFNDAASKLGLRVFDPSDRAEINACLDAAFERWRSGAFGTPMDREEIFDRRHQSRRIAEILDRLAGELPAARRA